MIERTRRDLLVAVAVAALGAVGLGKASRAQDRNGNNEMTEPHAPHGLHLARSAHAMTLLRDGRVLISGGVDAEGRPLASAEISRPGAPAQLIEGNQPRAGHAAALLPDGSVALIGGIDAQGAPVATIERFDPAANTLQTWAALRVARIGAAVTTLSDGAVFVAGGTGPDGIERQDAERITLTEGVSADPRTLRFRRSFATAVDLRGSGVLICGGAGDPESRETAELLPIGAADEPRLITLRAPRVIHTATLLAGGGVLIYSNGSGETVGDGAHAEIRTPEDEIRDGHTADLLTSGAVLVLGGVIPPYGQELLGNPLLIWPERAATEVVATAHELGFLNRAAHASVVLANGNVLFTGGRTLDAAATANCFMYSAADGAFRAINL